MEKMLLLAGGTRTSKTELKTGLKMRRKLLGKHVRKAAKFSVEELISASIFADASASSVMGLPWQDGSC